MSLQQIGNIGFARFGRRVDALPRTALGSGRYVKGTYECKKSGAQIACALTLNGLPDGMKLPLDPHGVVAPILEAPRALFGGVRDTTSGLVRLVAGGGTINTAAGVTTTGAKAVEPSSRVSTVWPRNSPATIASEKIVRSAAK